MSHISYNRKYKYKKSRFKTFKTFKISCLATIFILTCFALSISVFLPNIKAHQKYQFPNQIFLSEWQFKSSNTLDLNSKNGVIAAKQYLYISSNQEILRIDTLYIEGIVSIPQSLGLLGLKNLNSSLNIRYLESVGYYAVFTDQERVYLSSCINPRGSSTVTEEQFMNNRNIYDITPQRIGLYLIGFADLRDNRCLFTTLSIPLENQQLVNQPINSLDKTYRKLEEVWTNWYQKWQDDFPDG